MKTADEIIKGAKLADKNQGIFLKDMKKYKTLEAKLSNNPAYINNAAFSLKVVKIIGYIFLGIIFLIGFGIGAWIF